MTFLGKVFDVESDGDTVFLIPLGDATSFRYLDVQTESNKAIHLFDDPAAKHLVVAFGSVSVLGSIISSALIKVARRVNRDDGIVVFCNASAEMEQVWQGMNLGSLWPYVDTRDAALKTIRELT